MADARRIVAESEARRGRASYNTGSITPHDAYLLRAVVESVQAKIVIEVGTFIGASAHAMASGSHVTAVYTCDASNDCLDSDAVIRTFPKTSSTDMLRQIVARGVVADVCFFDGSLVEPDIDLLAQVCHARTVFVVHDYNYGPKIRKTGLVTVPRKGIGNVGLLGRRWSQWLLVEPVPESTMAALVPEGLL
jgi:predicted O-methyltransferase YrrM